MDHQDGQNECQEREKDRFTQKLTDEQLFMSAEHLAHPHLLGAPRSLCGGEVHKIEAGNEQNEEGNGGVDINVGDAAVGLDFRIEVGVKMDARDRPEVQLCPLRRTLARGTEPHIFVDKGWKLGGKGNRIELFGDQDIGCIVVAPPIPLQVLSPDGIGK